MSSTTPVPTVTTGDTWDAAMHNTYLRDNLLAMVPAIHQDPGDIFVASGGGAGGLIGIWPDTQNHAKFARWDAASVGVYWTPRAPQCQIWASSSITPQSVPDNAWAQATFDIDYWDNTNLFYTSGNYITIPANYGGVYLIHAQCYFDKHATANKQRGIGIQCSVAGTFYQSTLSPNGLQDVWMSELIIASLAAGETVGMIVYQLSGGALGCREKQLSLVRLQ